MIPEVSTGDPKASRVGELEPILSEDPARARLQALHTARRERIAVLNQSLVDLALRVAGRADVEWVLELGCGHGHFLVQYAAEHPHQECVGVDFCRDRIVRAERKKRFAARSNLHFLHAEAGEFFEAVPIGLRFSRVFVLFPDPWPKRRHRKHRLVNASSLDRITTLTREGGEFYFRSDASDYVADVGALLGLHGSWTKLDVTHLPISTTTIFQEKAQTYATVVGRRNQPSRTIRMSSTTSAPATNK